MGVEGVWVWRVSVCVWRVKVHVETRNGVDIVCGGGGGGGGTAVTLNSIGNRDTQRPAGLALRSSLT